MLDLISVVGLVLEEWMGMHSCVNKVERARLSTHVFGTMVDVSFTFVTFCGLLARKSIIHEHSEVESLRSVSLSTSF